MAEELKVECELSYAGCKERFLRQDRDKHMEQSAMKHMSLMAAATLRISREFEQKLQEKDTEMKQEFKKQDDELTKRDNEMKRELQNKGQQVRESAAEVMVIKKQLQETEQKFSEDINAMCMAAGRLPLNIIVKNYQELKRQDREWTSERFHTHHGGYRSTISVLPNGWKEGHGTHVAVCFCSRLGQFDSILSWPAKATITIHLLNQHRDQDHVTVTKRFAWAKDYANVGYFSTTFFPHAELGWNAEKQTQYLKDDCLHFRITKIQIHK